jgi:fructose-1,6-bisphosphatase/inositol monophosphatase family enzyme
MGIYCSFLACESEGTPFFELLTQLNSKVLVSFEKGNRVYANDSGMGSQACPLLKRSRIAAGMFHAENLERIGVKPKCFIGTNSLRPLRGFFSAPSA